MAICKQFTEVWKSAKFSDLSNIYNDLPLDDGVDFYFKMGEEVERSIQNKT